LLTRSIAAIPGVTFAWDFQTCESLVILTEIPGVGKHEIGSVLPWQVISSLIQRGGILDAWMLKSICLAPPAQADPCSAAVVAWRLPAPRL
jgi:hypothetical protein